MMIICTCSPYTAAAVPATRAYCTVSENPMDNNLTTCSVRSTCHWCMRIVGRILKNALLSSDTCSASCSGHCQYRSAIHKITRWVSAVNSYIRLGSITLPVTEHRAGCTVYINMVLFMRKFQQLLMHENEQAEAQQ